MLIEFKDVSSVRKAIEVEIPADTIHDELNAVAKEFAHHAKIPGFRHGKVPLNVVRTRYRQQIESEVLDRLLPQFFRTIVTDRQLEPVGNPALKRVDKMEEGKPVRFEAEFEVKPSFALQEYRGLEVKEPAVEVTDADIDAVVERLRDQSSSFRTIDDRGAQDDDYLIIDVSSSSEGLDARTTEAYSLHMGADAPLPELVENLKDKRPGDRVSFEKSYDETAPNEDVRGKTVKYDVAVKEVRVLEKPEIDDAFAKSVGIGENVGEMREKIAADLRRHKEHEALQAKRHEIGEQLVALHELDAPESLVEEELGKSMRNYARFLSSQGVDLEQAEVDWEKVRDEFQPEAVKRVKRSLILEAIARKETVTVPDAEVDSEIRKAAAGTNREFAEVKHRLREDGGYESLRLQMMQEKALEIVLRESKRA